MNVVHEMTPKKTKKENKEAAVNPSRVLSPILGYSIGLTK
jgi:hypothetical protein